MKAETLYQNQDILIDYVFDCCSKEMQDQITHIIEHDDFLQTIVEDMTVAITRHGLSYEVLSKRIKTLRTNLIAKCASSGK